METKLDSRQGQFPATFPDTFKDFFAMMSEDEDHLDLFSNLLEDKVIPRANRFSQRRYGGSLRCTSSSNSSHGSSVGRNTSGDGYMASHGVGGAQHNVGRSNSFRMNRPRNAFTNSTTALNSSVVTMGGGMSGSSSRSGSSGSLFCKHIKYCCLHQQQQQQKQTQQQQQQQRPMHKSSNQQLYPGTANGQKQQQQPLQTQPQHRQQSQQQQQQQQRQGGYHDYDYMTSTRLGPDGEDNNERNVVTANDGMLGSANATTGQQQQQQLQQQQQQQAAQLAQLQKRHSVILERAFDFDTSCDESDTISTTSSTPTACNIPYNVLKPILKQPQQQQFQPTVLNKTILKEKSSLPLQSNNTGGGGGNASAITTHRSLPQPPKGAAGAFHTKETALQRIQQQSRLFAGSKTNLAATAGPVPMTANNITGSGNGGALAGLNNGGCGSGGGGGGVVGGVGGGNNASESLNNNNHYNNSSTSSNYNLNETATVIAPTTTTPTATTTAAAVITATITNSRNPYMDLQSPTSTQLSTAGGGAAMSKFSNDFLSSMGGNGSADGSGSGLLGSTSRGNLSNIRAQKSPILNRRRSSSIAANLLTADIVYNWGNVADADEMNGLRGQGVVGMPHSNTRDRITLAKSPNANKTARVPSIPVESGVLTFQQAISGAVSPQYASTSPLLHSRGSIVGGSAATGLDAMCGSTTALASVLEDSPAADVSNAKAAPPYAAEVAHTHNGLLSGNLPSVASTAAATTNISGRYTTNMAATYGGKASVLHGSTATIAQLGNKQRQRMRTSSMPAESRKPRLAETRRAAIHCADIDLEYYRLRSFSITSHGVCNLGDSLRSRRSRSINSVTSTGTSTSGKDRNNSNASRTSGDIIFEQVDKRDAKGQVPAYKIAILGASGVGKTTLTYQFTTSDYICAYDLSLDDDYGQKTVSVLVDGIETDLEIIDHPACEMSTEAFCSTYNIDLFVVVYSVVDRNSFKAAEKVLQYLKENEMLLTRGAILVGNKTDLERHREVNRQMGRKVAKDIACKFIETSSGLDHNVDELLVGIVAQVKLNPQRIRNLSEHDRQRLNLQNTIQKHRRMHMPQRRMVRQVSMCQADDHDDDDDNEAGAGGHFDGVDENQSNNIMSTGDEGIGTGSERTASTSLSSGAGKSIASILASSNAMAKGPIRKTNKRTLNLESILKMGESEVEEEEDGQRHRHYSPGRPTSKFELLTASMKNSRTPFGSANSSPKARQSCQASAALCYVRKSGAGGVGACGGGNYHDIQVEENFLDASDCNRKTVSKLTNRTKVFLSSVLRFKKAINAKRRNSSSCSDLFVI